MIDILTGIGLYGGFLGLSYLLEGAFIPALIVFGILLILYQFVLPNTSKIVLFVGQGIDYLSVQRRQIVIVVLCVAMYFCIDPFGFDVSLVSSVTLGVFLLGAPVTTFFAAACGLLLLIPALIIGKQEYLAEGIAVLTYYFLVEGTVGEIIMRSKLGGYIRQLSMALSRLSVPNVAIPSLPTISMPTVSITKIPDITVPSVILNLLASLRSGFQDLKEKIPTFVGMTRMKFSMTLRFTKPQQNFTPFVVPVVPKIPKPSLTSKVATTIQPIQEWAQILVLRQKIYMMKLTGRIAYFVKSASRGIEDMLIHTGEQFIVLFDVLKEEYLEAKHSLLQKKLEIHLTTLTMPQVKFPSMPRVTAPKIVLPKVSLPHIDTPKLPKFVMPHINFDRVQGRISSLQTKLSDYQDNLIKDIAKVSLPHITLPRFRLPAISLSKEFVSTLQFFLFGAVTSAVIMYVVLFMPTITIETGGGLKVPKIYVSADKK